MTRSRRRTALNSRLTKLEHTLAAHRCTCPSRSDLAWPGHQPNDHCPNCGGERLIYPLPHHPASAETQLRHALPLIERAFAHSERADLSTLTNQELGQLKTALTALEQPPTTHDSPLATT